jgi:hypothetical protein
MTGPLEKSSLKRERKNNRELQRRLTFLQIPIHLKEKRRINNIKIFSKRTHSNKLFPKKDAFPAKVLIKRKILAR